VKYRKLIFIIVGVAMVLILAMGYGEPAKAALKDKSITKSLVYQKPLDISLGRGGVYFSSSSYTGSVVLTRIKAENTRKLTFTQRWSDIHLFDSKGKEFDKVYGYVYVYFKLNHQERAAWDKGELSIYHFNQTKKVWEECETQLLASKNAPYGLARFLITNEFGLYGLAIQE
jgi:hypothetical protein